MTPVAINVPVAMIERPESREIPQTPCPLVQPFPRTDPKPTKRPAKPSSAILLDITATEPCPNTPDQTGAASRSPTTKVIPIGNPFVSTAGGSRRETIPLIPATRPWLAIRMTADNPISIPPKSDVIGVNSVSKSKLPIVFTKPVTYKSTK